MNSTSTSVANPNEKTFLGHPIGLSFLFLTEMWERFSFYGMRALLTLYMVKYLLDDPARAERVLGMPTLRAILESGFGPLVSQQLASHIYGLYTGFVYMSPFFGGMIADRLWGRRKTVYVGGVLMAIGHFLMAFETLFFPALIFLILGNGAFKPNISTQVGALYPEGDPRRDGAFVIFYMGVNLGAAITPLVCGVLGQTYGWHYGFGAAGVGMILGLAIYHFTRNHLPKEPPPHNPAGPGFLALCIGGIFAFGIAFLAVLSSPTWVKIAVILAVIGAVTYFVKKLPTADEQNRVGAIILVGVVAIAFWAVYEQQGNTLQLWVDEKVDWAAMAFTLPFFGTVTPTSSLYQSLNPAIIVLFAPLLNMWWDFQVAKGKGTNSVHKMAIGSFLLGAAFIIMIVASHTMPEGEKSGLWWLASTTFVFTIGELFLSPIGLSFVTKISPPRLVSTMMGVWFFSSFLGNYLAGAIGSFYSVLPGDVFFGILVALGVGLGFVLLLMEKFLRKVVKDC